jgi:N-methylhydantoinase B
MPKSLQPAQGSTPAEIISQYGMKNYRIHGSPVGLFGRLTRELLRQFPDGVYTFTDYLDDDGVSESPVPIHVVLTVEGTMSWWFSGQRPRERQDQCGR